MKPRPLYHTEEMDTHSVWWQSWTRANLRQDLLITDADGIVRTRKGKLIVFELKTLGAKVTTQQSVTYQILHYCLTRCNGDSIPININGFNTNTTLDYQGVYFITFENTNFNNGLVYVNGVQSSEEQVIHLLNLE